MPNLSQFRILTFDCYGTLIDWETGLLQALADYLPEVLRKGDKETILQDFAQFEPEYQRQHPSALYPDVLAGVFRHLATHYDISYSEADALKFGQSIPKWPPFPDSVAALAYLKLHYPLAILSNIDSRSFAGSNQHLGVAFDYVFTAQEIRSYKPSIRNFEYMLDQLSQDGFQKNEILHVAQSVFHDHIPAKSIGLKTAWIDRRKHQAGWGATMPPETMPAVDFHFESMVEFADTHRKEVNG